MFWISFTRWLMFHRKLFGKRNFGIVRNPLARTIATFTQTSRPTSSLYPASKLRYELKTLQTPTLATLQQESMPTPNLIRLAMVRSDDEPHAAEFAEVIRKPTSGRSDEHEILWD